MATIRVRVNPVGNGEYVIYADAEDSQQPWLGQRSGAQYTGWEWNKDVSRNGRSSSCASHSSPANLDTPTGSRLRS